jgi:hypothetical protein
MKQPEGEPFRELLKIALPAPLRVVCVITKALTKKYGENVVMMQTGQFLVFRVVEKSREEPTNRGNENGQKGD